MRLVDDKMHPLSVLMSFEKKQNQYDLFPSTKRLVSMMSLGIPEFRIACRAQQSCFVALLI
jgi:hypothetical protein